MRVYIKEHSTEFSVAGAEDAQAEACEQEDKDRKTEAQEYAAQNRRSKQDEDYWMLQGALDNVISGFKSIGSGISTAIDTLSDLLGDVPGGKGSLMALLITVLLASNIYTYMARPASQHRAKKLQRFGPSEDDVAEALRIILDRRAAATPQDELSELVRLLDQVEARCAKLRESLPIVPSIPEAPQLEQLD